MNTRIQPDYLVSPGDILVEHLDARGFTQKEFASRVQITEKHISQIMTGKRSVTADSALKFEIVLGIPAKYWMDLESQYKLDKLRLEENVQGASVVEWAKQFPIKEMISSGWLPLVKTWEEKANALLRFFSVTSPDAWELQFGSVVAQCRRSVKKVPSTEAISAWIQRLDNEARASELPPYSKDKLLAHVPAIKECLASNPPDLQEHLKALFADAGVFLSFEKHLPRTYVNGVTAWVLDRPAIQLSSRYAYLDILAFSLFHEIAHTAFHKGKAPRFVDFEEYGSDPMEVEANNWAREQLIDNVAWQQFSSRRRLGWTPQTVTAFARTQQVHPGTVVGRLAWEKKIGWNDRLGSLRVKMPEA